MKKITQCKDHLGNTFPTTELMCKHWHINRTTFESRIRKGMSLQNALTIPAKNRKQPTTDHLGHTFASVEELCQHYHISVQNYHERRRKKWSIEKILTTPITQIITDHLGNTFSSKALMCKYWSINVRTYTSRIETLHWTQEQALTTPNTTHVTDPYGNTFSSTKELCEQYHVNLKQYYQQIKRKKSNLEALGILPVLCQNIKHYSIDEHFSIIRAINDKNQKGKYTPKYFECILSGHEIIVTYETILRYCQEHLPKHKNPKNNT